jgi:hypothetical protein
LLILFSVTYRRKTAYGEHSWNDSDRAGEKYAPPQIHMDRLRMNPGLYSERAMTKRDEMLAIYWIQKKCTETC